MLESGLKYIFKSVHSAFLPALIFAAAAFYETSLPIRGFENNLFFHGFFLSLSALSIVFFSVAKESRALLFVLCLMSSYFFLNGMKNLNGAAFFESASYRLLFLLFPLNLWFIAKMTRQNLRDINNFYIIILILGEGVLLENLPIEIPFLSTPYAFFGAIGLWLLVSCSFLLKASMVGAAREEGQLFMTLALFLAILNAKKPEALCLFFSAAVLILLGTVIVAEVYAYFKDEQTGVYSRHSFNIHSARRFPLKYSLGVVCIDDYAKLQKVFSKNELSELLKLVLSIVRKTPATYDIYRNGEDEFVLIFHKEDKKQSFQYLENIRREIAGTTFVLNRKKTVKITVSAGVSEKKRSDADADAVLTRTRDVLQKAYKFTQNMTSMA